MQHNYMKKIMQMQADGTLTKDGHITVSHDSWCAVHQGGYCNCEPDINEGKPSENRNARRHK